MPVIAHDTKETQVKIVYYGPAQSGKTTNVQQIHDCLRLVPGTEKSRMHRLVPKFDRSVALDFLPLETRLANGYRARCSIFTVIGTPNHGPLRRLALSGVDGVVFVADSRYERIRNSVRSFTELEENLESMELDPDEIPLVLQYNKQDLPTAAPKEYLDFVLNTRPVRAPSFAAVASDNRGVFESLNAIGRILLQPLLRSIADDGQTRFIVANRPRANALSAPSISASPAT